MHQEIDKKNKVYIYLFIFFLLSTFNNQKLVKSNLFKFDVNQVKVSGLSEKNNLLISKEIKKIFPSNIFFVKKEFLLTMLKKNNLINSFEVKKIYPDTIEVKIERTEFLGVTNINDSLFFIGSNGKFINHNDTNKNLPYVFGKIKIDNFIEFVKIIKKSKFNFNQIEEIYFFPSGRWDIKTKSDQLFKLPIENLRFKLNSISKINKNEKFKNAKIIDLRFNNKIITTNE